MAGLSFYWYSSRFRRLRKTYCTGYITINNIFQGCDLIIYASTLFKKIWYNTHILSTEFYIYCSCRWPVAILLLWTLGNESKPCWKYQSTWPTLTFCKPTFNVFNIKWMPSFWEWAPTICLLFHSLRRVQHFTVFHFENNPQPNANALHLQKHRS